MDKALKRMQTVANSLTNLKPALKDCSKIVLDSVEQNFDEAGRPVPWLHSLRVKRFGGKTLTLTGALRRSIKSKLFKNKVRIYTKKVYAAIHNFGGRSHTISGGTFYMPKRKFLMLQNKDISNMKKVIYKHVYRRNL